MKLSLSFCLSFLLLGCNVIHETSSNVTTQEKDTTRHYIEVFTVAPVINALVSDANNQVALYDENIQKYYFENRIHYPIKAQVQSNTYVDVDYDHNKTANDLQPSPFFQTHPLASFCTSVNLLTSIYYNTHLQDNNISSEDFENDIARHFNIDACQETTQQTQNAQVVFGAYNYALDMNQSFTLNDIESAVSEVHEFFQMYLTNFKTDTAKQHYYSSYDALVQLDRSKVSRVDTIHKPELSTILRPKLSMKKNSSGVDVFDILPYNNAIYVAAGHDELAKMDTQLRNQTFESNVTLQSFGKRFYMQSYHNDNCLFLANAKVGLSVFKIDSNGFTKEVNIDEYNNTSGVVRKFTQGVITNSNGYVSVNETKRLLGIATDKDGYYLINIKDGFKNCKSTMSDLDQRANFLLNGIHGYAVDATFRDDGTYLYVAMKTAGIQGYKTDILDAKEMNASIKNFTLHHQTEAYNLQLFNNDNELLVTTNEGLQIYDVGSAVDHLSYVSEYKTQGASVDYFQDIDTYNDYVFLTDGYQGIKVLKLSNSFEPMLCGAEYFAPKNNPYELAKTTSVKYDSGYLYVGIASYGIVKFKLQDILFSHCR